MVPGEGPQPPRGQPFLRGCQSPSLEGTRVPVSLVRAPREGSDGATSLQEPPSLCGAIGSCPPALTLRSASVFTEALSPLTFPLTAPVSQHRREGSPGLPLQAALPAVSPASQTRVRLFTPNTVLYVSISVKLLSAGKESRDWRPTVLSLLGFCSRAGLARVALTQGWPDLPAPRTRGRLAQPWEGTMEKGGRRSRRTREGRSKEKGVRRGCQGGAEAQ